jgi:hypothetical protein
MRLRVLLAIAFVAAPLYAQMSMMDHNDHDGPIPKQPAQAAFASIAEIARILKADSTTDWSKVDLEAVRQHMIDMDAVTMRAQVKQHSIPGGVTMAVTGDAQVAASIKRMLTSHAGMLDQDPRYRATVKPLANGVEFTVSGAEESPDHLRARAGSCGLVRADN